MRKSSIDPLRSEFIGLAIIAVRHDVAIQESPGIAWRNKEVRGADIKGEFLVSASDTECSCHCSVHKLLSCLRMALFSPPSVKVHPIARASIGMPFGSALRNC